MRPRPAHEGMRHFKKVAIVTICSDLGTNSRLGGGSALFWPCGLGTRPFPVTIALYYKTIIIEFDIYSNINILIDNNKYR